MLSSQQDIIDAIRDSDDGSTAPADAEVRQPMGY